MRRLLLILLLSGCGANGEDETDRAGSADPMAGAELLPGASPLEDPARVQARVALAMAAILENPQGARYANLRLGSAGAICGDVDPAGPTAARKGLRPFVVTPDGIAVISTGARIAFDDPQDPFPDYHIRWCATPEELATIPPEIPPAAAADPAPPVEPILELPPPQVARPAADPPAAASRYRPVERIEPGSSASSGKESEDSFSKAVLRPRKD